MNYKLLLNRSYKYGRWIPYHLSHSHLCVRLILVNRFQKTSKNDFQYRINQENTPELDAWVWNDFFSSPDEFFLASIEIFFAPDEFFFGPGELLSLVSSFWILLISPDDLGTWALAFSARTKIKDETVNGRAKKLTHALEGKGYVLFFTFDIS